MGSYITCVDLYSPNGMFWLKTDKRCPSCFEGSYICAYIYIHIYIYIYILKQQTPSKY